MARLTGSLWSVPPAMQHRRLVDAAQAGIDAIHWDHTDGVFAPQGGFSAARAEELVTGSDVESEAHLMVEDPVGELAAWARFCDLIIAPVEVGDPLVTLRAIEAVGSRPALAVSPDTDLSLVPRGDFAVLVMSVQPGHAGAAFRQGTVTRVRRLRDRGCHSLVGVDGGVSSGHLPDLAAAGADWIVSGTSLFGASGPRRWIDHARRSLVASTAGGASAAQP